MKFKNLFIICIFFLQINVALSQGKIKDTVQPVDTSGNGYPQRKVSPGGSVINQENEKPKRKIIRGFSFQAENDFFAGFLKLKNEDKDYSGGFKFEFYTDYLAKGIFPFFMNRRDPFSLKYNVNSVYIQGMGYTPNRDAFSQTTPVTNQRPYSSLIGIGRKRIAVFENPFKWDKDKFTNNKNVSKNLIIVSDLFLGKIGTKGPGKVQNFLHEYLTNSHKVEGWDNQIANGGKFAYNYNLLISYELISLKKDTLQRHFVVVTPHISIGNIFINQGFKLAVSNLRLNRQPSFLTINSGQVLTDTQNVKRNDSTKTKSKLCKWVKKFITPFNYEVYGKAYHINHNSLLMGLPIYDKSVYKIPRDRINKTVIDVGFKIYYTYSPDRRNKPQLMNRLTTVYFELLYRSKEFDIGPTHIYGGFGVQLLSL